MRNIPILDLQPEIELLWDELMPAIQSVIRAGHFIMGPNVAEFEMEAARYLGVKHAIGLNSGTDALVICLRSLGIGPGDEVITSPFTFFATAEAIEMVGAIPVFVDIDPLSYNLDPANLGRAITSRTKAILPVHLYGHAAHMEPILSLAKEYGLKIVEDVAQAFGGEYQGKKLGTLGDGGCFSFFPSKNLGAFGDGGMLATNDDDVADQARMLRTHGSKKKYFNEVLGYNSRLDELQAAILRVKLRHLDTWNEGRRAVAERYHALLEDIVGVVLPVEMFGDRHVYHQYTIRITGCKRDDVHNALREVGIQTMVYYPVPVHQLPYYRSTNQHLPVAEHAAKEVLSLPIWHHMPEEVQKHVANELKQILSSLS